MVSLSVMQASNARLASELPPRLVAVFAGATSGIGATSLKQFAKYAQEPRIYFVGRSQDAGDQIVKDCQELNPKGEYIYIKADVALLKTVDEVCHQIKSKETAINLLFLSTGTLRLQDTEEGLPLFWCLSYHSRTRFMVNLLPLLQKATGLRRVVTVLAAGKEGKIIPDDFDSRNVPLLATRGHSASLVTLGLEAVAKTAPDVSFIHNFPGPVNTDLGKEVNSTFLRILAVVFKMMGPLFCIPIQEVGERHLFFATSAKYPPAKGSDTGSGVSLPDGVVVATGTDGKVGSGVYSIHSDGESSGPAVVELLANYRNEGVVDKLWKHMEETFKRITGSVAA